MEKQTCRIGRLMDMGRGQERVRCMERVTWKLKLPYDLAIPLLGIYP